MPGTYPYLGNTARSYPQYRDTGTWGPLLAEPGGTYAMQPVAGLEEELAVPPGDGQWGKEGDPAVEWPLPRPEEPAAGDAAQGAGSGTEAGQGAGDESAAGDGKAKARPARAGKEG